MWGERFSKLLGQREKAVVSEGKREPPCMACYTKVPNLAKEVIASSQEMGASENVLAMIG